MDGSRVQGIVLQPWVQVQICFPFVTNVVMFNRYAATPAPSASRVRTLPTKSDTSPIFNSHPLSYPFGSNFDSLPPSYHQGSSLHCIDLPATRSPRAVNFLPPRTRQAHAFGLKVKLDPVLEDFGYLPQALVDVGWFAKELGLLDGMLSTVNRFRSKSNPLALYSVDEDLLDDLLDLLEDRCRVMWRAGAFLNHATPTLPVWGRNINGIKDTNIFNANDLEIIGAWFRRDVECYLHYLAYVFVNANECSRVVRIQAKSERWFEGRESRVQQGPEPSTTKTLTPRVHNNHDTRTHSPLPYLSQLPAPTKQSIADPKSLHPTRSPTSTVTPVTTVTSNSNTFQQSGTHSTSRVGLLGPLKFERTTWGSHKTATSIADEQAPVADAGSLAPNQREVVTHHHGVDKPLPPSSDLQLSPAITPTRRKHPLVHLPKPITRPPPFEASNMVTGCSGGLEETMFNGLSVRDADPFFMREEAYPSHLHTVSGPPQSITDSGNLHSTHQWDPIPSDRNNDLSRESLDFAIETGHAASRAMCKRHPEISGHVGEKNQHALYEDITDVIAGNPSSILDDQPVNSTTHPQRDLILAPPIDALSTQRQSDTMDRDQTCNIVHQSSNSAMETRWADFNALSHQQGVLEETGKND